MNKLATLSTFVVSVVATFVLATPTAVSAQEGPSDREFGHHVSECAQIAGMDGSHNPGMHRGISAWDGLPC